MDASYVGVPVRSPLRLLYDRESQTARREGAVDPVDARPRCEVRLVLAMAVERNVLAVAAEAGEEKRVERVAAGLGVQGVAGRQDAIEVEDAGLDLLWQPELASV